MTPASTAILRARILAAAALMVSGASKADSGDTGWNERTNEACLSGSECLPPVDALTAFQEPEKECKVVAVLGEGTVQGSSCCYPVQVTCTYEGVVMGCSFMSGRPLLLKGKSTKASLQETPHWKLEPLPSVEGLKESERAALAEFWVAQALSEHASIATFHRVALELLALGAPASLIIRVQAAASDEVRHARLCFGLASGYAGKALGPGRLDLTELSLSKTLKEVAVAAVAEGCMAEALAAQLAGVMLEQATDPAVQQVLKVIVADECRHAELAWETVHWAIEVGGTSVQAAVLKAFENLPPPPSDSTRLSQKQIEEAWEEGLRELVLPFKAMLLQAAPQRPPERYQHA